MYGLKNNFTLKMNDWNLRMAVSYYCNNTSSVRVPLSFYKLLNYLFREHKKNPGRAILFFAKWKEARSSCFHLHMKFIKKLYM